MLKEEMTEQELAGRADFVKQLVAAGWDVGGWERLFNNGFSLTPEAQAEYRNPKLTLRLSYYVKDDYILLEFRKQEATTLPAQENLIPSLRFYANGNLEPVLSGVIAEEHTLSQDNYPDFIKKMIPLCKFVLLEIEEGLVKLS